MLLEVVDDNVPHVIFPKSCATALKMETDKKVSVELGTQPAVLIKMLFDNSLTANAFFNYMSRWPTDRDDDDYYFRYLNSPDFRGR